MERGRELTEEVRMPSDRERRRESRRREGRGNRGSKSSRGKKCERS